MNPQGETTQQSHTEFSLAFTTTSTHESAHDIARRLVRLRLAACVQIVEIESHYVWKDAVEQAREFQLQMKIRTQDFDALCAALAEIHPYETPEILHVPILAAAPAYRNWLVAATGPVRES